MPSQSRGWAVLAVALAFCVASDTAVLRHALAGRSIAVGEVRRGYFEAIDGHTGLATDEVIRPVFPSCVLRDDGTLEVPPGMVTVAPLTAGTHYAIDATAERAPYIVIGAESPLDVHHDDDGVAGEGAIAVADTLDLGDDGHLQLIRWDPDRPWRDDAARLRHLREGCSGRRLEVTARDQHIQLSLGRCTVDVPRTTGAGGGLKLATLAGPEWLRVRRDPGWASERWFVWPVAAAIALKLATLLYAFGIGASVAVSLALFLGSLALPVPAVLTYPLPLAVGILGTLARIMLGGLRRVPRAARMPALVVLVLLIGAGAWAIASQPRSFPPVIPLGQARQPGEANRCALVGYSTVEDASLRQSMGGARYVLARDCGPCRDRTGSLSAGGEVLSWARDAFCQRDTKYGGGGDVIFLGGANDDFFWGVTALARLFVVSEQGIEAWEHNQQPAIEGSHAKLGEQLAALRELMACAATRSARFYFLHDYLISDLSGHRDRLRQEMLDARRRTVEAGNGRFVDLRALYASEAGVSWFNDYVHPSAIQHARIAADACRLIEGSAVGNRD